MAWDSKCCSVLFFSSVFFCILALFMALIIFEPNRIWIKTKQQIIMNTNLNYWFYIRRPVSVVVWVVSIIPSQRIATNRILRQFDSFLMVYASISLFVCPWLTESNLTSLWFFCVWPFWLWCYHILVIEFHDFWVWIRNKKNIFVPLSLASTRCRFRTHNKRYATNITHH